MLDPFKCAIVLRATLQVIGIIRSDGQALKLQRRKSVLRLWRTLRNLGEHLLARRQVGASQPTAVAL